jgi:hypothetical protein
MVACSPSGVASGVEDGRITVAPAPMWFVVGSCSKSRSLVASRAPLDGLRQTGQLLVSIRRLSVWATWIY